MVPNITTIPHRFVCQCDAAFGCELFDVQVTETKRKQSQMQWLMISVRNRRRLYGLGAGGRFMRRECPMKYEQESGEVPTQIAARLFAWSECVGHACMAY